MNDTGLFSGIYEGIRNRADLLDRVLVQLKAGTSAPGDSERRQLAAWLKSLADAGTSDYSARMIQLLLRSQRQSLQQGWAEIGESLDSGQVSSDVIDRLEELARALEKEQATALARLRGDS
jgi:uncharacterized Ntn-hydrolase superfamily protein